MQRLPLSGLRQMFTNSFHLGWYTVPRFAKQTARILARQGYITTCTSFHENLSITFRRQSKLRTKQCVPLEHWRETGIARENDSQKRTISRMLPECQDIPKIILSTTTISKSAFWRADYSDDTYMITLTTVLADRCKYIPKILLFRGRIPRIFQMQACFPGKQEYPDSVLVDRIASANLQRACDVSLSAETSAGAKQSSTNKSAQIYTAGLNRLVTQGGTNVHTESQITNASLIFCPHNPFPRVRYVLRLAISMLPAGRRCSICAPCGGAAMHLRCLEANWSFNTPVVTFMSAVKHGHAVPLIPLRLLSCRRERFCPRNIAVNRAIFPALIDNECFCLPSS